MNITNYNVFYQILSVLVKLFCEMMMYFSVPMDLDVRMKAVMIGAVFLIVSYEFMGRL